jgi:hypothetical protein
MILPLLQAPLEECGDAPYSFDFICFTRYHKSISEAMTSFREIRRPLWDPLFQISPHAVSLRLDGGWNPIMYPILIFWQSLCQTLDASVFAVQTLASIMKPHSEPPRATPAADVVMVHDLTPSASTLGAAADVYPDAIGIATPTKTPAPKRIRLGTPSPKG